MAERRKSVTRSRLSDKCDSCRLGRRFEAATEFRDQTLDWSGVRGECRTCTLRTERLLGTIAVLAVVAQRLVNDDDRNGLEVVDDDDDDSECSWSDMFSLCDV